MSVIESLDVNGIHVYHKRGGEQAIVFLHGAWGNGWQWLDNFFEFYSKEYDCYALDLRAHGESMPNQRINFQKLGNYVEDLANVISNIPGKPILFAHSMGGLVAQRYIKDNPDSLTKLVLIAPACRAGVWRTTAKSMVHDPLGFLLGNLKMNLKPLLNSPKKVKRVLFTKSYDHENMEDLLTHLQGESYVAYLQMMFHREFKPKSLNYPAIVIGADEDYIFSPKDIKKTAKRLGADYHIFKGKGHSLFIQEGWEEPADYINNWLHQ